MGNMRTAELFAGIGGFKRASELHGAETVFVSEIDEVPLSMYETLHGKADITGDITKVIPSDVPEHDILMGGFPCQGFSINGTREGFEYKTGGLFFEALRIAKAKRTKYILLENVPGLLNHDKRRTLSIMLKELSDCGYAVDFEILTSTNFGLAQQRSRVFIVGILDREQSEWGVSESKQVNTTKAVVKEYFSDIKTFNFGYTFTNNKVAQIKDIYADLERPKYLDLGDGLTNLGGGIWRIKDGTIKGYTDFEPVVNNTSIDYSFMVSKTRRGRVKQGITKTLDQSSDIAIFDGVGFRRINGLEAARLQGFSDMDYYKLKVAGYKENEIIRRFGRSVSIPVVESLLERFSEIQNKGE